MMKRVIEMERELLFAYNRNDSINLELFKIENDCISIELMEYNFLK